jgi:DNA-binding response OmpR family regulator
MIRPEEHCMARILIADDSHLNAELLEAHLEGTGFETRIVFNGEDTLKAAREWNPEAILLEVCRRLRADAATKEIGILMITALDQPTDIEQGVDAGTDDFITKPINKTELLLRLRALLESRTQASDIDRALAYMGRVQQGV